MPTPTIPCVTQNPCTFFARKYSNSSYSITTMYHHSRQKNFKILSMNGTNTRTAYRLAPLKRWHFTIFIICSNQQAAGITNYPPQRIPQRIPQRSKECRNSRNLPSKTAKYISIYIYIYYRVLFTYIFLNLHIYRRVS